MHREPKVVLGAFVRSAKLKIEAKDIREPSRKLAEQYPGIEPLRSPTAHYVEASVYECGCFV
ncbi:hypothetical protein FJ872_28770 [Mesorhizobium sp. B2-5-9]|nr:hypothetical protein FJ872_28770 [Mesorhizobium sp. B2-5-9]